MNLLKFQKETNLENVSHEDAVATLKSIKERATLVIQKSQHFIQTGTLNNSNSQSTGAVNNIGHSMIDGGRSPSPIPPTSRSHSPLPRK